MQILKFPTRNTATIISKYLKKNVNKTKKRKIKIYCIYETINRYTNSSYRYIHVCVIFEYKVTSLTYTEITNTKFSKLNIKFTYTCLKLYITII